MENSKEPCLYNTVAKSVVSQTKLDTDLGTYTVFLGCLPGKTTKKDILRIFEKYGRITKIKLKYRKGKIGTGSGTFTIDSKPAFEEIVRNPPAINGRKIICRKYFKGSAKKKYLEELKKKRLFLQKIHKTLSDYEIIEIIEKNIGTVERGYAVRDQDSKSLGYGFVNFISNESVKKALSIGKIMSPDRNMVLMVFLPYYGRGETKHNQKNEGYENAIEYRVKRSECQDLEDSISVKVRLDEDKDKRLRTKSTVLGSKRRASLSFEDDGLDKPKMDKIKKFCQKVEGNHLKLDNLFYFPIKFGFFEYLNTLRLANKMRKKLRKPTMIA